MRRLPLLLTALLAGVAAVLALVAAPVAGADPVPTNAGDAASAARAAAARAAHLQGRVRAQLNAVSRASAAADRADARYHAQLGVLRRTNVAAQRAAVAARRAEAAYEAQAARLGRFMAVQYETGADGFDAAQLLTAEDPSQMMALAESQTQLGRYTANLVDEAQAARDASDQANTTQQAALDSVRTATTQLKRLRDAAATKYASAARSLKTLKVELSRAQASQAVAETVLSLFLGGWSVADPAQAAALNARYAAIAAQFRNEPLAPRTPFWTEVMALSAVHRALRAIGTPYAWAGGNASGPTTGVCAGGDAANDCHVVGFDCSGLMLWAWSPYVSMPHYAASQWSYGRIHPAPSELLPGDLLFWSSNGRVSGIHHVAMYVGDGNVIQAPQSGDIVRITPMGSVSSGYFGATRPMS